MLYMKQILKLVFLLVIGQTAFGQAPSNYTNINGRYRWIAGMFDSTFHIPKGSTPSLRTGGSTNSGGLFYNTADSSVYTYTGTQWIKVRGSLNPSDTTNKYVTQVYKKSGSDSIFYVKGGTHTWAFNDSTGSPGGGGGGKVYYFNGGVDMGTIGGLQMYELGDTANTGAAANFTRATTGNIANFITDPGKPGLVQIPAGVWSVDAWLSETGGGANHAEIWIEVEKWDGSTITTIATSPIEQITEGATPNLYSWSVTIPTTSLAITDRIIIQFYISNTNGKTVTLYTQNGYVGEVHTTFTTGIGAINGLTAPAQYLVTGTSGTDFNINSSTATHTFNLPTASATNRGALSTTDWSTFNNKIGGTLVSGYLTKATGTNTIDTSQIYQSSGLIGIGTTTPAQKLDINGDVLINGLIAGRGTGNINTNAVLGRLAFNFNTTGFQNVAIGNLALYSNTTGANNVAIGNSALSANTTANHNVAIGHNSMLSNTTGFQNTAVGIQSLGQNTTGENNTGIGNGALGVSTTGYENVALGTNAGRYITAGGNNTTSNQSVYIGADTRASANGNTNEIVIGKSAIGNGSNSVTLGNASITKTVLRENVGVGTVSPDSALTVVNGAYFQRGIRASGLPTAPGTKALRINANGTLSIADTLANGISGTGTTNYIPKFTSSSAIGNSNIYDDGTNVGIGTTSIGSRLQVNGNAAIGYSASTAAPTNGLAVSGNVGIGTTLPDRLLVISATNPSMSIKSTTTTGFSELYFGDSAADLGWLGYAHNGDYMYFGVNNAERMRITSGGNIGINTTSPNVSGFNRALTISSANSGIELTSSTNVLEGSIGSNTAGLILEGIGTSGMRFFTSASGATSERMRINSAGNVLIGTTTDAGQKLQVNGSGLFTGVITANSGTNNTPSLLVYGNTGSGVRQRFLNQASSGLYNWQIGTSITATNLFEIQASTAVDGTTFTTSAFVVASGGSVGIGSTSLTGYNLRVAKSITGATTSLGIVSDGAIQADVTNTAAYFRSVASASATPFALTDLAHFQATTGSLGSASVTSQYGFLVSSSMTGASNNFAFYGNLAAATGRWNLFMNGTANNYLAGNLSIGSTSLNASAALQVVSTTQGFLPPVMSGSQAEAISTPATGLMVYANNGNGTTITSTGWWGYDGATWVKLN